MGTRPLLTPSPLANSAGMSTLARRPLVPEDRNGHRPALYLQRAAYAHALATVKLRSGPPEAVARERWGDGVTELLLVRSAAAPATTASPSWAGALAGEAVADYVSSLEPISAGARVLNAAMRISLDRVASLKIPRKDGPTAPSAFWIEESQAIPVPKFSLAGAELAPRKLAAISVMTSELLQSSSGEVVLTTLLREACALALDMKLFSADVATAEAPGGLLAGIAPATGSGDALADLSSIAAAIAPFTAGGLVFVAHPVQASYLSLRRGVTVAADLVVWPTLGVPPGTIVGLDAAAVVAGFGPEPEFRTSIDTVLHMEDAAPTDIGVPGSPPIVSAPSKSMFQIDCVATRMILRAAWTWRLTGAAAWVTGATWGSAP